MLTGRNIICVSSIDWDFVWQGHQEIMSIFAKNNNRVLYIENTGIRAPRLNDIRRLRHRIANWRRGIRGIRQESENIFICSPLILPFPYSRVAKLINRALLLNNIKAWMKATGFKNPVIWTFLPTSVSLDIIDNIDNSLVVYYCIAEFAQLADSSKKVNKAEAQLLRLCDVVFAQGEEIKKRCEIYNRNVHIFPFGVKTGVFLKAPAAAEPPADMLGIKRPVLGYIGGIHKHIDFGLLTAVAERIPEASIVLVGPVQAKEAEALKARENVYFLGQKDHAELPRYVDNFDLCLIPYLLTDYTKTVYPTKLNEYLMRGKHVLSTGLPEVMKFVGTFGDVVAISADGDDFIRKARRLLDSPVRPELSRRLIEVASRNDWEKRVGEMSEAIEVAIARKEGELSSTWRDNFLRLTKAAKGKGISFAVILAVSYMALFHTPFLWWAAGPLKLSGALKKADAVVVLGGGVGETGRAGQGYEERVKYACDLYKDRYAGKMIFSSGFVYAFKEPDVMKALAVSLGVRPGDIILEKAAQSTYENVKFSMEIARRQGYRSLIFVSSPYHMRRLEMTAARLGGVYGYEKDDLVFSPIPYSLFYGDGKRVLPRHVRAILSEYMRIAYYKLKGYI